MEIVITRQIVCSLSLSRSVNFVPVQYKTHQSAPVRVGGVSGWLGRQSMLKELIFLLKGTTGNTDTLSKYIVPID